MPFQQDTESMLGVLCQKRVLFFWKSWSCIYIERNECVGDSEWLSPFIIPIWNDTTMYISKIIVKNKFCKRYTMIRTYGPFWRMNIWIIGKIYCLLMVTLQPTNVPHHWTHANSWSTMVTELMKDEKLRVQIFQGQIARIFYRD
jgi:hypothetical protein